MSSDAKEKRAAVGIGLSDGTYLTATSSTTNGGSGFSASGGFNPHKHLSELHGIEFYAVDVVVKRTGKSHQHEHNRGDITELSADSLGRLAFIAFNTEADFQSMLTLTYAGIPTDGREVKQDLDRFLKWFRRNYPGEKYLWFLEFQKRGAPHFHIITTVDLAKIGQLEAQPFEGEPGRIEPSGKRLARVKRSNGKYWRTHWDTHIKSQDAWGKGWTAWEVMEEKDGGKRYAAKYATKAYQKQVPEQYQNVGRFWGHSREGVKPEPKAFYRCSESMLRQALTDGGWEYLPPEDGFIFRELYGAASKIDVDQLAWSPNLDPMTNNDIVWAETGEKPRLILGDGMELKGPGRSQQGYTCEKCGSQSPKWAGYCPSCSEWNTMVQTDVTRPKIATETRQDAPGKDFRVMSTQFTVKAKLGDTEQFYSAVHGWQPVYELATWYAEDDLKIGFLLDDAIARGAKVKIISRRSPKPGRAGPDREPGRAVW